MTLKYYKRNALNNEYLTDGYEAVLSIISKPLFMLFHLRNFVAYHCIHFYFLNTLSMTKVELRQMNIQYSMLTNTEAWIRKLEYGRIGQVLVRPMCMKLQAGSRVYWNRIHKLVSGCCCYRKKLLFYNDCSWANETINMYMLII